MACIYTEHPSEPLAEIRVVGRVTQHDMDEVLPKITAFIERHGNIRLLEIVEVMKGFDTSTILDGIKFDYNHLQHITHAAIVSDISWIGLLTRAAGMIMPVSLRAFPLAEVEAAREWALTADREAANPAA